MKAAALVAWLKKEFDLVHGHSMAIWAAFKDRGWVDPPKDSQHNHDLWQTQQHVNMRNVSKVRFTAA
jgi:hypothetical protein